MAKESRSMWRPFQGPPEEQVRIEMGEYAIVPMALHHALSMRSWGKHESALYREYNYADLTESEMRGWYAVRSTRENRYYAIEDAEHRCVGFIGLKEINRLRKRATLGFAVDKNRLDQGIGTEAMRQFLPVFFGELGFQSMILFLYEYNERAYRVYQKLGFTLVDKTVDEIRNRENFPTEEELRRYSDAFIPTREGYFFTVFQMRLTKSEFKGRRQA